MELSPAAMESQMPVYLSCMADDGMPESAARLHALERALHAATQSVDVLSDALSPDDFADLKAAAELRMQKVDDAFAAVFADMEKATPHLADGIRAQQRDLRAELDGATYDGDRPPDAMSVTGEYER
jgi:hypothetical protein